MTVRPFPVGRLLEPHHLDVSSRIAYVDSVACDHCHHLWTASKKTGDLVQRVEAAAAADDRRTARSQVSRVQAARQRTKAWLQPSSIALLG